ncbi:sacsin N-terminal ATP-binding-like domain-containing protein [Salinibacterium sp. ZJ70]|uniref:sacsin N-terminal ATP-binding-like domain-containing protein n=1 Tax=Salinibacterium sp. ZJ70 TaxID=2708084 RepID=UPI00141E5B82|nr:DEAD/DEAH box helicase family protein [Salinibacterium sp. ZJ70]
MHQDAGIEQQIAGGGYEHRQIEELAQNAVDAAREGGSRIEIVLTRDALYVANDGKPFTRAGVEAVMASHISNKDDDSIGKFGIGFKSILAISSRPMILSRTVGLAFDAEWSKATLLDEGYEFPIYPTMRLAKTVDPNVEAQRDPILASLMPWASTVIVAPLNQKGHYSLSKRLYAFPDEFVLFSPHIKRVAIRNLAESDPEARKDRPGRPAEREIERSIEADGTVVIRSGRNVSRWTIASVEHEPSAKALDEAGRLAARKRLTVSYALKLPPKNDLGTFWAYFPTKEQTSLSGLINAAWKLTEDRIHVLESRFNEELLKRVPALFGQAIQRLSERGEGVLALDAMPARGKEIRSWGDEVLNEPMFDHLRRLPSLADGTGRLRVPSELKWLGDMDEAMLAAWAEVPGAPIADWVHADAYRSAERRNRVERLRPGKGADSVQSWLEALVPEPTVETSAAAIAFAARLSSSLRNVADTTQRRRIDQGLASARIVLLENGELSAPSRGQVFVRIPGEARDDVAYVNAELAELPGVKDALAELGVVIMDRTGELHALLKRVTDSRVASETGRLWAQIWNVLRDIPLDHALTILREDLGDDFETRIRVRTGDGGWSDTANSFLAGAIVPPDGSRDRAFLIDPAFHREDAELLRAIGAVDAPTVRHDAPKEAWLDSYEDSVADAFIRAQSTMKPERSKLVISGPRPPWPLDPVLRMSEDARIAVTEHLIAQGFASKWTVEHATNRQYGRHHVMGPEAWFVKRHGLVRTEFGVMPITRPLRASEDIDPRILPAIEVGGALAEMLELREDPDDLSANDWKQAKEVADRWISSDEADSRRIEFYTWLPTRYTPETVMVRVGRSTQQVELENVGVTSDRGVYESMLEAQIPAALVALPEDADRFIEHWGMRKGSDLLQEEIVIKASGEPSYLTDVFPPLKLHLELEDQDLMLQPVDTLEKMIATARGQVAKRINFYREGSTLYATAHDDQRALLQQVSQLTGLGLSDSDISSVLDQMSKSKANELRVQLAHAQNDDERLVSAVGIDALRRIVPAQAVKALEARPEGITDSDIAALARAVHGVSILKQLRPALEERGLEPPREFTGRQRTRAWVRSLGFPVEWAGFPEARRPAIEHIDGPVDLKPLHDYQEQVTLRIAALLKGVGKDRGMVSLPTGAGKTRVTVQALIEGVKAGDIPLDRPLIWIAQSDELCEQAAETWTYVWRAIGSGTPMSLGRLWASNEVDEEPDTFQLIIATDAKLLAITRRSAEQYEWLRNPSVVVIDEAHQSIASEYTQVLEWLGRGTRGRNTAERKPLMGLTATPFRGTSEEETKRLALRYDHNRLDRGSFRNDDDPYGELQEMGVLAHVDQMLLDGVDVHLSVEDVTAIERSRLLPAAVSERIGSDLDRTQRLVNSICSQDPSWTMLVFCPSVENSRVLAGLLTQRGVPAVSISSDTEPAARRHYIDEFKAGRIRVLTNFGVLIQGFDAPNVRAVYLARPTFSPNVYQQMVGRGLRGPKNGGSDRVLIVNVKDNFDQFGDLLAFNQFEHLWRRV